MSRYTTQLQPIDEEGEGSVRASTPHTKVGEMLLEDGSFIKIPLHKGEEILEDTTTLSLYELVQDSDKEHITLMISRNLSGVAIYNYLHSLKYPATVCWAALNFHGIEFSHNPIVKEQLGVLDSSSATTVPHTERRGAASSGYSSELLGDFDDHASDESD